MRGLYLPLIHPSHFGAWTSAALGLVTGLFASIGGWQINLTSIHRGLQRGRTAAFSVGSGASSADLLIIFAAFTGAAKIEAHQGVWAVLRWVGVATLLILSVRILFKKHRLEEGEAAPKKRRKPLKSFLLGFVLVAANPAVWLLWFGVVGFLLTHFPREPILSAKSSFLGGFFAGASVWFLVLALAMVPGIRKWGEQKLEILSQGSALLLLMAAVFLVFAKL
jgi:threonine/homoserine/homoserine lactone efflux protein